MRIKNYKISIVSLVITLFFSCGKDKKEQKEMNADSTEKEWVSTTNIDATETKSTVVFENEEITKIYDQYLNVKAGMVNANTDIVRKEGKKLELLIPKDKEHKQLRAVANLISLTKNIDKQRDFMVTLTEEVEKWINTATITSGAIYKQFCPMAFDGNGGYWLSDSKEIRNPYFGSKMLTCGSVKETID